MACIKNTQNFILQENYNTYPSLTPCHLFLSESLLIIKHANKNDLENLWIADIVGCQSVVKSEKWKKDGANDVSAYLRVYYYPLKTSASLLYKQLRREKQVVKFVMHRFQTYEENAHVVDQWRTAILWLIRGKKITNTNGEIQIPNNVPSALKLLFIINPNSGAGRASNIFKEQVLPILQESNVEYEVLRTDKANCAHDYIKSIDLKKWSGFVVVAGDGLLFEVYNGLMARSDWEVAVKMPVGIIPGGSGNGLARAISYATGEPYDTSIVTPSILNIIHGRVSPMDLVCVHTPNGPVYSFLSIGWGIMADIDIESEKLRSIGEARFTVWAFIRALGLRTYRGKLSYLPVHGYDPDSNGKFLSGPRMKRSKTMDSRPIDAKAFSNLNETEPLFRSKSFGNGKSELPGCNSKVELLHFTNSGDFSPSNLENQYSKSSIHKGSSGCDSPDLDLVDDESSDRDSLDENTCLKRKSLISSLPPLTEPVPEDWIVEDGDFVLVYVCHQTHLSTDVMFAPDAKLDDGIMWLTFIRSGVSRAKVIYFLSSLQAGDHINIPYVTVVPIHAFRLEPSKSDDILTVDGEAIPCSSIQAEVLPSIARVMTR